MIVILEATYMRRYVLYITCFLSSICGICGLSYAQDSSFSVDAEFLGMGNLYQINAHKAYELGITGQGVTVAVIDTGINYFHPELFPQIADGGFNFYQNTFDYMDYNGHGSLVSGIVAASRDGYGMHGVAYNSKILPLKVTSDNGEFYSHEEINRALYRAIQENVSIINYSGTYALDDGFTLDDDGITASNGFFYTAIDDRAIVAAAGNTSNDNPLFPALLPYVKPENHNNGIYQFKSDIETDVSALNWSASENNIIAVVAADENGAISDFSNRCGVAAAWCITAPGEDITTTFWYDYYVSFEGTSLAAPTVSGALALLKELFPHLSNAQLIDLLLSTANKNGIYADQTIYGQGFIDIGAAVNPQGLLRLVGSNGFSTDVTLQQSSITTGGAFGNSLQNNLNSYSTLISDHYDRSYVVSLNGLARQGSSHRLALDEKMRLLNIAGQAQHYQVNDQLSYMSFAPIETFETKDRLENAMLGYQSGNHMLHYRKGNATWFDASPDRSSIYLKNKLFRPAYMDMTTSGHAIDWQYAVNDNTSFSVFYRDGESFYDENLKAKSSGVNFRFHGYHGTKLDLTYGFVREDDSVMGTTGTGAFAFANNAHTDYIGGSLRIPVLDNTTLIGSYYTGQTKAKGSSTSLIKNISTLKHQQASMGIEHGNIWHGDDRLSFIWEMPLHVRSGNIDLNLYNTNASNGINIDLSAQAEETNLHLFYDTPLPSINGSLGAHITYSNNTGHIDNSRNMEFLVHLRRTF